MPPCAACLPLPGQRSLRRQVALHRLQGREQAEESCHHVGTAGYCWGTVGYCWVLLPATRCLHRPQLSCNERGLGRAVLLALGHLPAVWRGLYNRGCLMSPLLPGLVLPCQAYRLPRPATLLQHGRAAAWQLWAGGQSLRHPCPHPGAGQPGRAGTDVRAAAHAVCRPAPCCGGSGSGGSWRSRWAVRADPHTCSTSAGAGCSWLVAPHWPLPSTPTLPPPSPPTRAHRFLENVNITGVALRRFFGGFKRLNTISIKNSRLEPQPLPRQVGGRLGCLGGRAAGVGTQGRQRRLILLRLSLCSLAGQSAVASEQRPAVLALGLLPAAS